MTSVLSLIGIVAVFSVISKVVLTLANFFNNYKHNKLDKQRVLSSIDYAAKNSKEEIEFKNKVLEHLGLQ